MRLWYHFMQAVLKERNAVNSLQHMCKSLSEEKFAAQSELSAALLDTEQVQPLLTHY